MKTRPKQVGVSPHDPWIRDALLFTVFYWTMLIPYLIYAAYN